MTFVHFTVDGDRLAVPLSEIAEVARVAQIAPVPRAPSVIRGLANIRGRVVTLLDMDVLYGRGAGGGPPASGEGHAVVLAAPRENLALFTRSRVDVARGGLASVAGRGGPAPGIVAAAEAGPADAAARESSGPPAGTLVHCEGVVAHLLPPAEIAAHCEARVLERYRRRA
jgi:purine-binding chemotaxis protein CheW